VVLLYKARIWFSAKYIKLILCFIAQVCFRIDLFLMMPVESIQRCFPVSCYQIAHRQFGDFKGHRPALPAPAVIAAG
jgi:hypothetical protein